MQTLEQLREQDRRTEILQGPTGLGGWLILPMIGMFLTPVIAAIGMRDLLPLLSAASGLNATQTLLVWFEVVVNLVLQVGMPIYLLTLFFKRKHQFPSIYAGWLTVNLIVVLVDLVLVYNAFRPYYDTPGVEFWDPDTAQTVSRTIFGVAIWVPYMFNSKRVKNTFVN
jgi:hypothetical protein